MMLYLFCFCDDLVKYLPVCFMLFVEEGWKAIAIQALFEGFVHVDGGAGTVKECCGDCWLLLLERAQDCLGDNLASVLRRMLRKRNF